MEIMMQNALAWKQWKNFTAIATAFINEFGVIDEQSILM